jgi:hypothetical protein
MIPQMEPVDSEAISAAGYDPFNQVLYVTFRKSRQTYSYRGVIQEAFDQMLAAKSIGGHFAKNILPHHTGVKA